MSGRLQVGDSFLLMIAFAGFLDESGTAPLFFAAAALHEAGHVLMVYACGGTVTMLRLTALGGVLRYRLSKVSMLKDVAIAAAGPITGIGIALLTVGSGWYRFAGANLILSMLNLLPIRPLDGGQIVSVLLQGGWGQIALEMICCLLLGLLAGAVLCRGGGCSFLIVCGVLLVNLQKNLQKTNAGYKM